MMSRARTIWLKSSTLQQARADVRCHRASKEDTTAADSAAQPPSAPVLVLLEAGQELVEQHHLPGRAHEPLDGVEVFLVAAELLLGSAEQEGVVAALFQLDDDVEQRNLRSAPLRRVDNP